MLISLLLSSYLAATQDKYYLFHLFLQCDIPQRNCSDDEKKNIAFQVIHQSLEVLPVF